MPGCQRSQAVGQPRPGDSDPVQPPVLHRVEVHQRRSTGQEVAAIRRAEVTRRNRIRYLLTHQDRSDRHPRAQRFSEGRSLFYFPALLPFYDEGLERNIGPFLRLFEYYRFGPERSYLRVLWGLYRYERERDLRIHELAFLLGVRSGKGTLFVRLLNGLFGVGKLGGRWHLEILWKDF